MLPVTVMEKPNFPPFVCVKCGSQSARDYFVDLGITLETFYNPAIYGANAYEGAIYLCSSCWEDLERNVTRQVIAFKESKIKTELDDGRNTDDLCDPNLTGLLTNSNGNVEESEGNDRSSEPDDSQSTDSDSESDNDADTKELADFRGFFGN